jgi:pimeloyl-ACP methyl ester carboxylesterase
MNILRRDGNPRVRALVAGALVVCGIGVTIPGAAQDFQSLRTPGSPLVLRAQGSFYVGGKLKETEAGDLGEGSEPGRMPVDQMYVEYMVPHRSRVKVAVVMIHGADQTGKTYGTTPDGRSGWSEFFVRKGHPVYVVDRVSFGRSGFDPVIFNRVRSGRLGAKELPDVQRNNEDIWVALRFGPKVGVPFPDTLFPVEAAGELAKSSVPEFYAASDNSRQATDSMAAATQQNYVALAELAAELKGAVLMGHSEAGAFPFEAALLNPDGVKGMIMLEGACSRFKPSGELTAYTDEQVKRLAQIPILVVFGDHLDVPGPLPKHSWKDILDDCRTLVARIQATHGNASVLYTHDLNIFGNSHMLMQDRNSDQIAGLIESWMQKRVH